MKRLYIKEEEEEEDGLLKTKKTTTEESLKERQDGQSWFRVEGPRYENPVCSRMGFEKDVCQKEEQSFRKVCRIEEDRLLR